MAFCGNCGNELREGAVYCPKCGTAVGNTNRSNGTSSKSYVKWIGALALLAVLCVGGYFGYNALSSDSPGEVAVKAYTGLKNSDAKEFASYLYSPQNMTRKEKLDKLESVAKTEEFREYETKYLSLFSIFGGIKDVSMASEEINGDKAVVKLKIISNNGIVDYFDSNLRRQDNGEWGLVFDN